MKQILNGHVEVPGGRLMRVAHVCILFYAWCKGIGTFKLITWEMIVTSIMLGTPNSCIEILYRTM